jgi:protein-S-isoprenylcysteine O-methyltransferase Ste14
VFFIVLAASLFLAAGRIDWLPGWIFLAVYLAIAVAAVAYLWHTNPEILIARSSVRWSDQTAGQNILVAVLITLFIAMFPIAALDAARLHWSNVPIWLAVTGYLLFLIGNAGSVWVFRVNKFAEPAARIQSERSHSVIDRGPYAIVRHPLYAVTFFICLGLPLALGSYLAFIPSGLAYLLLVVRTAMEDRMLHAGLGGYREYARRVRYRLVPGVW